MTAPIPNRRLRCRLGIHTMHLHRNDSGEGFLVCEHCGKEQFPTPIHFASGGFGI